MGDFTTQEQERRKFNRRRQEENESIQEFADALKEMAQTCNFSDMDYELERQFTGSLRSAQVTKQLDKMNGGPANSRMSFEQTLQMAKILEENVVDQPEKMTIQGLKVTNTLVAGGTGNYISCRGDPNGNLRYPENMPKPTPSQMNRGWSNKDAIVGQKLGVIDLSQNPTAKDNAQKREE